MLFFVQMLARAPPALAHFQDCVLVIGFWRGLHVVEVVGKSSRSGRGQEVVGKWSNMKYKILKYQFTISHIPKVCMCKTKISKYHRSVYRVPTHQICDINYQLSTYPIFEYQLSTYEVSTHPISKCHVCERPNHTYPNINYPTINILTNQNSSIETSTIHIQISS